MEDNQFSLLLFRTANIEETEISRQEYEIVSKLSDQLLYAQYAEEFYDHIIENYLEFEEDAMRQLLRLSVVGGIKEVIFDRLRMLFDRRLMNILTAARKYLDAIKSLGHKISDEIEICDQIESCKTTQYDTCIGYRTMEWFRNIAQHTTEQPLHGTGFRSKWLEDHSEGEHSIGITFSPKFLPTPRKAKHKKVYRELCDKGENLDIRPLLREYIVSLSKVHEVYRSSVKRHLSRIEEEYSSRFLKHLPDEDKESRLLLVKAIRKNAHGEEIEHVDIFQELMERRHFLEDKNGIQRNLSRRHVTSSVSK